MDFVSLPFKIFDHPPHVIVEVFDLDLLLEDRLIARCCVSPMVKVDPDDSRRPILQWFDLTLENAPAGKLLAAFELILVSFFLCSSLLGK